MRLHARGIVNVPVTQRSDAMTASAAYNPEPHLFAHFFVITSSL
jgi:hypothetical protein